MAAPSQNFFHITTDDTLRETLSHGSENYPFAYYLEDIWQFDFHCIDWHWHHEVEFVSVTEGRALCFVGEEKIELPEGFGLFVNSGILHRYEALDKTIIPNILSSPFFFAGEKSLVSEKYVLPVIYSGTAYQVFDPQVAWQNTVLGFLTEIYEEQDKDEKNELQTMQLILKLWDVMFAHFDLNSGPFGVRHINHRQAKLQIMMQYIHDHYWERITLGQIAQAASVSKSSALNLFQAGIHISPVSYLIQYRLKRAGELLCTTEKPVAVISEETGFSDAGYFCRKFRERYHTSPNGYRKMNAENVQAI